MSDLDIFQLMSDREWVKRVTEDDGSELILECARANGQKILSEWKDELANLLTFIGLFSAVVTGFIVFSLPFLSEDSGKTSNQLLAQISQQLSSFSVTPQSINSTSPPLIPDPFRANPRLVHVNVLWILSLTMSLMAGFFTISVQQWLRRIPLPTNLTVNETIRLRQLRYNGIYQWKVPEIVSLLPIAVQISVVLFLAGIVFLLETVNQTVAKTTLAFGSAILLLWVIMSILPLLFHECPYKTPLIPVLLAIFKICTPFPAYPIIFAANILCFPIEAYRRRSFKTVERGSALLAKIDGGVISSMRVFGHYLAAAPERLRVRLIHRISMFYQWMSNPMSFWVDRDIRVMHGRSARLDCHALADAAYMVPRHLLDTIRDKGLSQLPYNERPNFGLRFLAAQLSTRQQDVFDLLSVRTTVLFANKAGIAALHGTLFELRETLLKCVPNEWRPEGGTWTFKQIGVDGATSEEVPASQGASLYCYDQKIAQLLCFLHRSTLSPRPDTRITSPSFFDEFAGVVRKIGRVQSTGSIIANPDTRLPMTLLFKYCKHGLTTLPSTELVDLMQWSITLLNDISSYSQDWTWRTRTTLSASLPSYYEISFLETALCGVATVLLSARRQAQRLHSGLGERGRDDEDEKVPALELQETRTHADGKDVAQEQEHEQPTHMLEVHIEGRREGEHALPVLDVSSLLPPLESFLSATVDEVIFLTDQISYLPKKSHIFMLIPAIKSIAKSLAILAEVPGSHVADSSGCPSRHVMTLLSRVSDRHIFGQKFGGMQKRLSDFDELWAGRWCAIPGQATGNDTDIPVNVLPG